MKTIVKTGSVTIPDGVKVTIVSRIVTVKGPRGSVTKNLKHLPVEMVFTDEKTIKIDRWFTYGKKNKVEIRNFLGEKVVRTVDCYEGVTVARSEAIKDEIVLVGNDIENVSKTCALIQQICA